jgi:hypothetical protein
MDQFDCQLPYVDAPEPIPGEETVRLINKPFRMVHSQSGEQRCQGHFKSVRKDLQITDTYFFFPAF